MQKCLKQTKRFRFTQLNQWKGKCARYTPDSEPIIASPRPRRFNMIGSGMEAWNSCGGTRQACCVFDWLCSTTMRGTPAIFWDRALLCIWTTLLCLQFTDTYNHVNHIRLKLAEPTALDSWFVQLWRARRYLGMSWLLKGSLVRLRASLERVGAKVEVAMNELA